MVKIKEVRTSSMVYKLGLPVEEPLGVGKYRWNLWYTMNAVHQSRRKAVFDKFNPLEGRRFL